MPCELVVIAAPEPVMPDFSLHRLLGPSSAQKLGNALPDMHNFVLNRQWSYMIFMRHKGA